jgi:hypothetical protein
MAAVQYLYPDNQDKSNNHALVSQAFDLARYMCSECSLAFRPGFARGMLRYLAQDFDPALIRAVIDETSKVPCPSWAYFAAIMRRAEMEHASSLADFCLYRRSAKQVSAQQYTQRDYTEADLLAVSDDLIAEARRLRDQ